MLFRCFKCLKMKNKVFHLKKLNIRALLCQIHLILQSRNTDIWYLIYTIPGILTGINHIKNKYNEFYEITGHFTGQRTI